MPTPREIAIKENGHGAFEDEPAGYDWTNGVPSGVSPTGTPRDYAANPTNPPAGTAPAKNLKR